MFLLLTYFIDSVIGKMFTSTSICYDGKDLEEPLGGVPTISLILQVTINTVAISVLVKYPYIWIFFDIRNT